MAAAALAVAIAPVAGCGSAAVQQSYWREDLALLADGSIAGVPYIYGGTILDVSVVAGAVGARDESSIGVLLILDLPFSLVVDTLLLPLCIYQQVDRAGWTEERFIARLGGGSADERKTAAGSLGVLDGTTERTTDALATALGDPEARVRIAALTALARRGAASATAAPRAARLLHDPDPEVCAAAVRSLVPLGADRAQVARALLEVLDHDDLHVRIVAIHALGELGAGAGAELVRARLEPLRSDPVPAVNNAATHALERFDREH